MYKAELVSAIVEKAGTKKKDTEAVLNAFVEVVKAAVEAGDKVQLIGFGTFEARERAARKGTNPKTGERIDIPACTVPAFKVAKSFKDSLK